MNKCNRGLADLVANARIGSLDVDDATAQNRRELLLTQIQLHGAYNFMKKETKDTHIYFPVELYEALKKVAEINRRSISTEVVIAVEKHVKANTPKK